MLRQFGTSGYGGTATNPRVDISPSIITYTGRLHRRNLRLGFVLAEHFDSLRPRWKACPPRPEMTIWVVARGLVGIMQLAALEPIKGGAPTRLLRADRAGGPAVLGMLAVGARPHPELPLATPHSRRCAGDSEVRIGM